MATKDLFGNPHTRSSQDTGLLVTNHLNLMYILSAGLVMPPVGFQGKYYDDTLGCFPGWIPLFVDRVPRQAVDLSTREAGYLTPVVVEIELSGLSGQVAAYRNDTLCELGFPEELDGTEQAFLIPTPLPTSWIKSIVYESPAARRSCEANAKDFENVPINDFKRRSKRALFTKTTDMAWPPPSGPVDRETTLHVPSAAGGAMTTLLHIANQGDLTVQACMRAFDPHTSASPTVMQPTLDAIASWMEMGWPPSLREDTGKDLAVLRDTTQNRLFWSAVEQLLDWRQNTTSRSAEEVLLNFLTEAVATLDPRLQSGTRRLCDTLSSLTGLADATIGELFDRHPTPMARAMILFFVRDNAVGLLEFRHEKLQEPDWILAAILFGVRDGWQRLPLPLRALPGLSSAVSHRMASMAHRIARTGIDLGDEPPRVKPLRELLGDGANWRRRERKLALDIARAQNWDCVHTRVSFPRGDYRLSVANGAAHIDIAGEPKIVPQVDTAKFFKLLSRARLDNGVETKVRKQHGI